MAVALYARVSTTRQAENDLSIPDQLKQMREWCAANGYAVAQEYIEPGASATDDKRPVFQQMIRETTLDPSPFEAVVVHSQSRFFRNSIDFGLYERKLNQADVRLISITQLTSEDASGDMVRKIFSVFDEFQSKETSKHTARSMLENARQGFFNGAHPPFGYKAIETEVQGNRGRKKKRFAIDEGEAEIVRRIFNLYIHGDKGTGMRAGELLKLKWSSIDFDKKFLTIQSSHAKSKKKRHIPLNKIAIDVLTKWRQQTGSDFVFPGIDGGQAYDISRGPWESVLKQAEITDFRWHDLRHHFASRLVMASVDLNTVRELLGHSDIKMMLRYAHLAPEHKAAAVAALEV